MDHVTVDHDTVDQRPVIRHSGRSRWRRLPRRVRVAIFIMLGTILALSAPFAWTEFTAAGHLFSETDAPHADVVLVLGAQVAPDGVQPMPFLRGRLDTASALLANGSAKTILVSGDAHGASGNETDVMTHYLTHEMGIDPKRVVADPDGLDTYDSCVRAKQVYGVVSALVVTQSYHLARAVTLCRHAGLAAEGVRARCDGCSQITTAKNTIRDFFACGKAAWDVLTNRAPAVSTRAIRRTGRSSPASTDPNRWP